VFVPVARLDTVRLPVSWAAHSGWQIHHMDVKSAFLNCELQEEVFVQQLEGYEKKGSEHNVLKLKKTLYGLHQAPRAWNSKLDVTLTACSSGQTHCVHYSSSSSGRTPRASVR
jgi:hypothetical protein